jgi:MarR-like DNA-binding transcriptional regulator SgrR of sgrS sRNA
MDRPLIARRTFLRTSAAALAYAALAPGARRARAEARPGYGGHMLASLTSAPVALEPLAAWSYAEQTVASLLFDTLYRVDASGAVVPQLASGLPEPDARHFRVPLRKGVRCHDGHELAPRDVGAALRRAARAPVGAWAFRDVEKVWDDDEALHIGMLRKLSPADLALALSAPQLAIARDASTRTPIGTGPFKLGARAAHRLELDAHLECFAGRPYADQLTLRWFDRADDEARAYEIGDGDVSLRGAVAFAGHQPKHATQVVDGAATWLVFLGFGKANARVTDAPAFRAALSQAIGRAAFKHVGSGERVVAALVPESPDLGGATPDASAQAAHPEAARAALAPAAPLRLSLIIDRSRLDDADVATRVIAALDAAGIAASVEALEPAEHARRVAAGKCDLWLGQLCAPTPDPLHEILLAFAAGGDAWATRERAQKRLDRAGALAAWGQRWPVVPLYHRAVRAHHRETWHGLGFDALGRLTFADAFLTEASLPDKGEGRR